MSGRRPSERLIFARKHGLTRKQVDRIGIARLEAMTDEAKDILLGSGLGVPNHELHKGGLAARGFKVRNKSA